MFDQIFKKLINDIYENKPRLSELEDYVSKLSNVNIIDDHDGESLMEEIIFICSYKRDITPLLTLLINKGADVNYQDWLGNTCLHMAIYERSYSSMELLFKHGANPNLIRIEQSHTVLDFALEERFMSDEKDDKDELDEIIKLVIHYGGKSHIHLFTKKVDTYLLVDRYYPTGLVTKDGNIFVEDIPNIDQLKKEEFYYWLFDGPADWLFEKDPEHPLIKEYYKKLDAWCDYFSGLFNNQIIVDSSSVKISDTVCNLRQEAYKQSNNMDGIQ